MSFVAECVADSMPIWEQCLNSSFLQKMENGTLDENCFKGYIVDDSLYLWEYAKVFAWGIVNSQDMEAMRTFYSFLSFVNEGEGSTRLQYLHRYGLRDEDVQKLSQRPQNKAYTDCMLRGAQLGVAECMMASLPCTLSYGWIFRKMLERTPSVRSSVYWPMIRDYAEESYEVICRRWVAFGDKICHNLPEERLKRCMEIFRECSVHELHFWEMSDEPRSDLPL